MRALQEMGYRQYRWISSGIGSKEVVLEGEALSGQEGHGTESGDVRQLEDGKFYGLLQFTCGLPTPALSDADASAVSRAVTVGDVRERQRTLRSWLLPQKGDFQFHCLTDVLPPERALPDHSWLLDLSRHTARHLPKFFPHGPGDPLPEGFPGALDWNRPKDGGKAPWTHYLRVQRARDDSSYTLTDQTDCNDYLIRDGDIPMSKSGFTRGSLWELQLFFCEFLAQRRGAIFASHVSERIYNVWLPPGEIRLSESDSKAERRRFAWLPVVTVVRRPYRTDWRYAMSLSTLFVPLWPDGGPGPLWPNSARPMGAHDVVDLVSSTSGNSTYMHASAAIECDLADDSPLHRYLSEIVNDDRRDFCARYTGPRFCSRHAGSRDRPRHDVPKTLRGWIELLLLTAAELPRRTDERVDDRILLEYQQADDRILPDEVLRCLRVNDFWSVLLLTDSMEACTAASNVAHNRWWPVPTQPRGTVDDLASAVPGSVADLLELFAQGNRSFPPTPEDRVDVLSTGGRAHMTWRIPGQHTIVTVYRRADDAFPSFSSLNLAGWFAYMAVGVTCAWQTMYSLTHETDKLTDVAELSQLGHDRIMDLEDVYDLDVAWPAYEDFYRRLRGLLGVERQYRNIKERLDLLFTFAQAEQRTRDDRSNNEEIRLRSQEQQLAASRMHLVETAAAAVGGFILLVSVLILLVTWDKSSLSKSDAWWVFSIFLGALVLVGVALRSRVRRIDAELRDLIMSLTRLAKAPESSANDNRVGGATGYSVADIEAKRRKLERR